MGARGGLLAPFGREALLQRVPEVDDIRGALQLRRLDLLALGLLIDDLTQRRLVELFGPKFRWSGFRQFALPSGASGSPRTPDGSWRRCSANVVNGDGPSELGTAAAHPAEMAGAFIIEGCHTLTSG
jgi:hypothetical protein